ncbi:hypothetical protein BMS3Abin05_00447 [bacterium BMS3Abin05]|nr:hypothetical protein BMS3Abin05_00447 [bacterium BMS3Abin05]GBE26808.1 hypothetical protein BMS3Bbin03_00727 [bacterium BMS3Bbin03]HDK35842.1 MerR family transcriptional regulator [Bacteroidota bacterium]HDL78749.1 MerR family transcriptional regulator [Bacteroidota bacterium]HDZ12762.1 MerR family transcriptional regulator [Bacteroidota bacterium]
MAEVRLLTSKEVICKLDISLRQLYYWELKGIVKPKSILMGSREFKRYSTQDVKTLKQIKYYLDEGYTLARAIQKSNPNTN